MRKKGVSVYDGCDHRFGHACGSVRHAVGLPVREAASGPSRGLIPRSKDRPEAPAGAVPALLFVF